MIAYSHANIGAVLEKKGQFEESWISYNKKNQDIYNRQLDTNHPNAVDIFRCLDRVLRAKETKMS